MYSVIVFGASEFIRSMLNGKMKIIHVVDNNSSLHGSFFLGHEVQHPNSIRGLAVDILLIGTHQTEEVVCDANSLSVAYKVTYNPKDFGFVPGLESLQQSESYKPFVSVIMPTYNRSPTLPRALRSLCGQSYKNLELLLVDDGSEDNTEQVASSFIEIASFKVNYIKIYKNSGVSVARNTGLKEARGEIIAYLDSDNAWHHRFLEIMVNLFSLSGKSTGYCGLNLWRDSYARCSVRSEAFNFERLCARNFIDLNVFVHYSRCLNSAGLFNENLTRLVDWDFIMRLTQLYPPFYSPLVLCDYDDRGSQSRITTTENWDSNLKIIQELRQERVAKVTRP